MSTVRAQPVAGMPIAIVGRDPAGIRWLTHSWMRSVPRPHRVPPRVFDTYEHALIERYWKDPGHQVLFACNPANTQLYYGYLVGTHTDVGPILHYVYVRQTMRDSQSAGLYLGVTRSLIATWLTGLGRPEVISHTRTSPPWEQKLREDPAVRELAGRWLYNPYLAYEEFRG